MSFLEPVWIKLKRYLWATASDPTDWLIYILIFLIVYLAAHR